MPLPHRRSPCAARGLWHACLAAVALVPRAAPAQSAAAARSAEPFKWRMAPRALLTSGGDSIYVDQPRAVRIAGRTTLLGFPTLSSKAGNLTGFGVGVTLDGPAVARIVPLPPGQRRFRAPVVALAPASAAGTPVVAHVVWSGRESPSEGEADTLWYGRWDGRRWSAPERVWVGTDARWYEGNVSDLLPRGDAMDVFVAGRNDRGTARLIHLHREAARWSASDVSPLGAPVLGLAVAPLSKPGEFLVAYLNSTVMPGDSANPNVIPGPLPGWRTLDRNSIYVGRLASPARTLTGVRRLHSGLSDRAVELRLARHAPGRISVFWLANRETPDGVLSSLHIARSLDGGREWRSEAPLALGGAAGGMRFDASGPADTVRATFALTSGAGPSPSLGLSPYSGTPSCAPSDDGPGTNAARLGVALTTTAGWSLAALPVGPRTIAATYRADGGAQVLWAVGLPALPGTLPFSCVAAP